MDLIAAEFGTVSILSSKEFSFVFLVDIILGVLLTLFIVFFFNRFVGWVLSILLRFWFWHRHKVHVKVQSVQLSLLGGRLFFKNFSYVGTNEAVCVLQGHLTWRYWLWNSRKSSLEGAFDNDPSLAAKNLPIRWTLHLSGLEWFVFNRSPAYDALFASAEKAHAQGNPASTLESEGSDDRTEKSGDAIYQDDSAQEPSKREGQTLSGGGGDGIRGEAPRRRASTASLLNIGLKDIGYWEKFYLLLFPVEITCNKGALVVGDKDVPSLMILNFTSGECAVDVEKPHSSLDKYMTSFSTHLYQPRLQLRPHIDYKTDEPGSRLFRVSNRKQRSGLIKFIRNLDGLARKARHGVNQAWTGDPDSSNTAGGSRGFAWHGLSRYDLFGPYDEEDEEEEEVIGFDTEFLEEYGKSTTVVDTEEAEITYFYDVAGLVPFHALPTASSDGPDIGNSGSPPQWGMRLLFKDSTINYGPWADRQRIPLQDLLMPRSCVDAVPDSRLQFMDQRVSTKFTCEVAFEGEVFIRIPMREPSKNPAFVSEHKNDPSVTRPFGWIELKAKSDSHIFLDWQMVPSTSPWQNEFVFDLVNPEIRTSVNHGLLFAADYHKSRILVESPLKWNGLQQWRFFHTSDNVQLFFLREHVTLLSDLIQDFSAGPDVPYDLFTPFRYTSDWRIHDYKLFLNINDLNIINNPSDFEENTYVTFQGKALRVGIDLPLDTISPIKNTMTFEISTQRFDMVLDAPPWHTIDNFIGSPSCGRSYDFQLKGSYTYYSTVEDYNTDTLVMEVYGSDTTFVAYGFILKYLMRVRENYFGERVHFKTSEEYAENPEEIIAPPEFRHQQIDNDLDVLIHVYVNNGGIVLPENIYNASSHLFLRFSSFDIDVRFTNYYMDLQANATPTTGFHNDGVDAEVLLDLAKNCVPSEPLVFIDGIAIHGHRIFGLPPTEPTYFCKWDFDLGDVLVNGPVSLGDMLVKVVACVDYTFADIENRILLPEPPLHDVTFVSAKVASVKVHLQTDHNTLEAITSAIDFKFHDLANNRYSARISLKVPLVSISLLDKTSKVSRGAEYPITMVFRTSLVVSNFIQKANFHEARTKQQDHITMHDAPFHRCPFLLDKEHRESNEYVSGPTSGIVPSIPLPSVPPAMTRSTMKYIDPHMTGLFALRDNDDLGSSSISSRTKYSSTATNTSSDSDSVSSSHSSNYMDTRTSISESQVDGSNSLKDSEGSSFLAPKDWHHFVTVGNDIRAPKVDFALNPSSDYGDASGVGQPMELDERYMHDSAIIQFGPVDGYVSARAILGIEEVITAVSTESVSLESKMDQLQVELFQRIQQIHTPLKAPKVTNVRVVVPTLNIKYGRLRGSFNRDLDHHYIGSDQSHIFLDIADLNLQVRIREPEPGHTKDRNSTEKLEKSSTTVFTRLSSVSFGIRKEIGPMDSVAAGTSDHNPFTFQIESASAWWYERDESFGSMRIRSTDLMIISSQVPWITDFLNERVSEVKLLSRTSQIVDTLDSMHNRTAYVVYELAKAGVDFRVERDPYVLTRPAFVIQSPEHVRASFSWKIIQRLRHVLRNVSHEWIKDRTEKLASGRFNLPSDARKRVVDIFSNWRPWEFTDISQSLIFPYVFDDTSFIKGHFLSQPTKVSIDMESFLLRLQHTNSEDFLLFDYFKLTGGWKLQEKNSLISVPLGVLEAECSLYFKHSRTRFSSLIVPVISGLTTILGTIPDTESEPMAGDSPPSPLPVIRLSATLVLEGYVAELSSPSLGWHLDGEGFIISVLGEHHAERNVTGVVTAKAWRAGMSLSFKSNNVSEGLFNCHIRDFESSFVGKSDNSMNTAIVRAAEVTLALHVDLMELLRVVQQVVKVDVEQIKGDLSNQATPGSASRTTTKADIGGRSFCQPLRVSFELGRFRLGAALLPSLSLDFHATGMNHKIYYEESLFAGAFSIDTSELQVFLGIAHTRALKIQTIACSATTAIFQDSSIEGLLAAKGTEIIFMPISDILRFVQDANIDYEARMIETELAALQDIMGPQKSESKTTFANLSFRMDIEALSIVAPMYSYVSFVDTSDFHLEFRNVGEIVEAAPERATSREFIASVSEHIVSLKADGMHSEGVPIVSVKLDVCVKGSGQGNIPGMRYDTVIKSDHFRVLLSPEITHHILRLGSHLSRDIRAVEKKIHVEHEMPERVEASSDSDSGIFQEILQAIDQVSTRASCSILLSNVALSWMFDESHSTGFVFGYETLTFGLKHLQANMVLRNVYATPIPEDMDLFDRSSPAELPNTAFLPSVELVAQISEERPSSSVSLRLTGESVHLVYTPRIVSIGMELGHSVAHAMSHEITQDIFGAVPETTTPMKRKRTVPFRLPFSLIVGVRFDGVFIELWEEAEFPHRKPKLPRARRNSDAGQTGPRPALMLETPGLSAHMEYCHVGGRIPEVHDTFDMFIVITSSSNVLYPRLVPVVLKMSSLVSEVLEERRRLTTSSVHTSLHDQERTTIAQSAELDIHLLPADTDDVGEMVTLFSEVDINMKAHFERQELTLSCLPTAKVEATVALDWWYLGANTCVSPESGRLLALTSEFSNFKTSLQHIYSREVSGYVGFQHVMFTGYKNKHMTEPLRASAKVSDFVVEINLKQLQDLELFQDIWIPRKEAEVVPVSLELHESSQSVVTLLEDESEGMLSKYWKPTAKRMAIPWSIVICVNNSAGSVDLGQSIGRWSLTMDRWWLTMRKTSEWEQHMSTQFDEIMLKSDGRLGGQVVLSKLRLRTAIMWQQDEAVPLVQAVATFSSFEAALSLDYHLFCIVSIQRLGFSTTNQRGIHGKVGDKLLVNGECSSVSVLTTVLVASNFYDIYQTISRLRMASNASYEAILQESADPLEPKSRPAAKVKLETNKVREIMTNIRTYFDFRVDSVGIFVFPNSFRDDVVFAVRLKNWIASFIQRQILRDEQRVLESKVVLDSDGCQVAVSNIRRAFEDDLAHAPPTEFANFVLESAKGGTIISVPTLRIKMVAWQPENTYVVEHVFTSSIGGKVDVGWNLGSINLIREMWTMHARAFNSRIQPSARGRRPSSVSLDENLRDVQLDSTYTYVAREPPIIATPQLRDMGEATPPMEWLGLHRQKIPGLVHQTIIRGFQESTGEIGM